jgi:TonB family protein
MHGSKKEPCRSAPRISVRSNQIAYLNFHSGNGGIVLDVSTNGLGFQAVEPLKANELLPFRLSVPGFAHIHLSGQVAWLDESRKRGGLRVTVPVAERRAFQLWQQQYLASQVQASESSSNTRDAESASQPRLEAKQSRVSRNVLVGCLLVTLCVALADASQFASAARRIGGLLSHFGRRSSGTMTQSASAARNAIPLAQNAPHAVAPRSPNSRPANPKTPNPGDTRQFAQAASPRPPRAARSRVNPNPAEGIASATSPRLRPAPPLIAPVSAAIASRTAAGKRLHPDSPLRRPITRAVRPKPQNSTPPSALAAGTTTPHGSSATAAARRLAAQQTAPASSSPAASSPAASQPFASAAQPAGALNSQTPEASENFEPCQLVDSVQPAYPKQARKQHVQGDVKLRVVVGPDGAIESVTPLGGPPLLIAAAMRATRQFHYKPALLNGKPIQTIQTVSISFSLQ